jgi:hypothetical protein
MNVEDLIIALAMSNSVNLNKWDEKLVYSFMDQIGRGLGFTEKQANVSLKIVKTHSGQLNIITGTDIQAFLTNPTFRYPFRQINNVKRISIKTHELLGKCVKVEFPYNEAYVALIRKNKDRLEYAQWNPDEKAWIFALTETSIKVLLEIVSTEQFEFDEIFQTYAEQANAICEHMEEFVPMLALDQGTPIFLNISKNLPPLKSTNTALALFEARRKGVVTWSDEIIEKFNDLGFDPIVRSFLDSDPGQPFHINSEKMPISCLSTFVSLMSPTLFIIPGGNEIKKVEQAYDFLRGQGITNKDISVMFRLDSKIDEKFNNFVKENELNSPIGENTKIVFISSKMPKPVLKSNIKFHSVINMGHESVHYSIRDFVKNHENLIYYSEKKAQRDFDFVVM